MSLLLAAAATTLAAADEDRAPEAPRISETIVVTGSNARADDASFETRHVLPDDALRAAHGDAGEAIDKLPSTHVPTNSRGETLVYLRNAAERQVAVFYEGAAINVPWDNRIDLSLVPLGLVGNVQSATGPIAPHYGVNALGAVALSPRDARRGGDLALSAGEAGWREARAWLAAPLGTTDDVAIGASYTKQDGQPLADGADLPFSQADPDLRTNTDRELAGAFARVRTALGAHRLSITVFHVAAEKGVAPESDRPSGARFWRYPDVEHTLAAAHLDSALGGHTDLDSVFWYQRFGQTIDSYTDAGYSQVDAREIDRDETFGLRELLSHEVGRVRLVGSLNFLESTHRQRDIAFEDGEAPARLPPFLDYRQRNWSVAIETELQAGDRLAAEIGLGYDRVEYVETGDKPPMPDSGGWSGRAAVVWSGPDGLRLRAAIGRKVRSPTMRELFGNALNRFLINPDLKPERIVTAELGVEWQQERGSLYLVPFYQHLDGTIDQRNVGRLRQRINLVGSRVAGIELGGDYRPAPDWQLSGSVTWAQARRRGTQPGESSRLAEKPDLIANFRVVFAPQGPLSAEFGVELAGPSYSADDAGQLVRLSGSTAFSLGVRYRLPPSLGAAELFLDAQNVTGAFIEPQIGLPEPGRWIRGGVRVGW